MKRINIFMLGFVLFMLSSAYMMMKFTNRERRKHLLEQARVEYCIQFDDNIKEGYTHLHACDFDAVHRSDSIAHILDRKIDSIDLLLFALENN